MSVMGRPLIEIDWEKFEFACKLMATKDEICGLLKISDATLQRKVNEKYGKTFEDTLKELSGETKLSLRRKQIKVAIEDGNVTMLIWLGKNLLGQEDSALIDQSNYHTFQIVNYGEKVGSNKNSNRVVPAA